MHTFAEAAEELLAMKGKELVNPKHLAQWRMTLRDYAGPVLGHLPVAGIGLDEVLRALKPHWEARPETASRLRGRIEAVLSLATVMGWREGPNPATWGGNLAMLLPARSRVKKVRHQPALAVADVPEWFERLRERKGISARALEFLTLTWARSGEVRGATWNEIDLRAGVWTIPAEKMKAGREHVVPLSPDAVSLLKSSGKIEGSDLIFPGAQGKPLSDMTLAAVMKRMHEYRVVSEDCPDGWADPSSGRPAVPHGLRSTARVWAGENGWPVDLAEHGLAHKLPDPVELAYNRSSYVSRRAPMMQAWADFLHQRPEAARQAPPHLQAV